MPASGRELENILQLGEAGKSIGVSKVAVSQALLNNRIIKKKTYSIKRKT